MKTTLLHLDRWLCINLYPPIRQWWSKLWIRKDEFHPSLEINADYMAKLNPEQLAEYESNLIHRRNIAHKRDLKDSLVK